MYHTELHLNVSWLDLSIKLGPHCFIYPLIALEIELLFTYKKEDRLYFFPLLLEKVEWMCRFPPLLSNDLSQFLAHKKTLY